MNTILVIGGTSGIGEAFAKRFHSMGKKVIVAGRREDKLAGLKKSLSGLETYQMDLGDLSSLPGHVETLFKQHSNIDTVWVNSGVQQTSSIKDINSTTDAKVSEEVTVNLTAPMILARHVIPHLAAQTSETNFMITSSGLAFVPVGSLFPVYCPTKAAIHSYLVGIRQALKDTKVNVLELVPPYVGDTEIDMGHRDQLKNSLPTPLPLSDFTNDIFKVLDNNQAKDLKEISAGSGVGRVEAWRGSIGKNFLDQGLGG